MRVRNGNGLTGSSEACLRPKASRSQPSRREPASEDSHSWKVRAVSYLRSQHRRGWRQRLFWALQACITTARSSVGSRSRTRCMPKAGRSSSNFIMLVASQTANCSLAVARRLGLPKCCTAASTVTTAGTRSRSLVGHRANHISQPRMPAPTGHRGPPHPRASVGHASFRSSSAIGPWRSQYSRCVSPLSRHASKLPRHSALTASRLCNRSRPTPPSSPMTSGQDKIAPPHLKQPSRARNGRSQTSLIRRFNSLICRFNSLIRPN